ncbi:head decoration protein [Microbacterium sp. QXD-8]|uniref:Head decoration protein n=1 Tax=Microbacterium psychrotolerans TaxID=3068321 RepID=A0ABU0Z0L2_9MICO|nr:head decoration protein [Microbacterium sp. QXD-8]MDQ7877364.1 head decoration protein [Microbacterium sp. QXD-8]
MPKLRQETFGSGDMSWLGSSHGIRNARTGIIDISAFTANTHYPDGYIPSGTPVALVGGLYVPYDKTEGTTTNAGVLAGFILTDQPVVGTADFGAPILDHGRINVAKVPYSGGFAAPVAAAKRANITCVFV